MEKLWAPPGLPVNAKWPVAFLQGKEKIKIALVGEAPGETEEKKGEPFQGAAGGELSSMLSSAGINRSECLITNVFRYRPPGNKIEEFCVKRADLPDPKSYPLPYLKSGHYVRPELLRELDILRDTLLRAKPNVVVALGNTALWALTGRTGIGGLRGAVCESTLLPGIKVLPTYHPAAVLRDWTLRVIVIADLIKAKDEAEFPEFKRPERVIWIAEKLSDLNIFSQWVGSSGIFPDIETDPKRGLLKCIGLALSPFFSMVVPFVDMRNPDWSYWSLEDEIEVWKWLRDFLKRHPCTGQNFSYDFQWLFRHGVVPNYREDTMLMQHALYPELPKSLAFLGSIHTNEPAWKLDRPRGGKSAKRED